MPLFLWGCLDHEQAPGSEEAFVAMQTDFAAFRAWASVEVAAATDEHGTGARTVYTNAGESGENLPVGTIVVKVADDEIHAMAKRGGGFNPDGAVGWEWFGLGLAADGTPVIEWRGASPPDGEGYGSTGTDTAVEGECNTCHLSAWATDYVHTELP